MGYYTFSAVLLFCTLLACFVSLTECTNNEEDIRDSINRINPIMRYRFTNQLRKKLPTLEVLAQRRNEYRNCYFSPIQCQLPVRREGLLAAILRPESDPNSELARLKRLLY